MMSKTNGKPNFSLIAVRIFLITTILSSVIFGAALPKSLASAKSFASENFPLESSGISAAANSEWTQEGHDVQRTGYTAEEPLEPWSLAWNWNGPDANGGAGGHIYNAPTEAHTITGGNYVFVPAGSSGLYALDKSNGAQAWHLASPAFNATPAFDPATGDLFSGGADGKLYKIESTTGNVLGTYSAGSGLNKAILLAGNAAYAVTDSGELLKVNTGDMSQAWRYSAGSNASTPAAYSTSAGLLIYATQDLNVHAVQEANGAALWKVKPTSHAAQSPYTFAGFWPVVAEQHGIVFVRLNLGTDALWSGTQQGTSGGGVYPQSNAEIRDLLLANNGKLENLFALNLKDGSKKFIPAVGYGGVEYRTDSGSGLYLQSGPVPVIKVNADGSEVAYIPFRSAQGNVPDGRWDSHMGEMVLDDTTVPGLAAGDMRFVDFPNSYVKITDEQTPFTMAGSTLFHAHWGASESVKILDRSAGKGLSASTPITSQAHPTVIRRQQSCSNFNPQTHQTSCGLTLFGDGRYWNGPGFWVYWNVMDPPTPTSGAYSDGLLPRYTYASAGLIIVEGNGGELSVFRYGSSPALTSTPTLTSLPGATKTATPLPTATKTPTQQQPIATKTATRTPAATQLATLPPAITATPGASMHSQTLDTYADFDSTCTVLSNVHISDQNNGRVELAARMTDDFNKSSLNGAYWSSGSLNSQTYTAPRPKDSVLIAPGIGYVRSKSRYTHGVIEATAQFNAGSGEQIGFGVNPSTGNQFFSFTTQNGDGNLYARVKNNGEEQLANLGPVPDGMHRYRLEWTAINASTDGINFYLDGAPVAQMQEISMGAKNWYVYLSNTGTNTLALNQVQVTPTYVGSGTYTSCILDAGEEAAWQNATWNTTLPAGTGLTIKSRTSADGKIWKAWTTITRSGNKISSPNRYVQIQAYLRTTNSKNSPFLNSITISTFAPLPTTAPTSTSQPTRTNTLVPTRTPTNAVTALPTATRVVPQTATLTATKTYTSVPTTPPVGTTVPTRIASPTPTSPITSDRISQLQVVAGSPAVYEKFEVQFSVQTSATNLDMPFDPNPPAGVQAELGVTVNGLFSADNWKTTLTQPGFLYQPYTHTLVAGTDHFTPTGAPIWAVRFAPQQAGNWQYRLSVVDRQGQSYYPALGQNALSFNVGTTSTNPNISKGFVGVSATDSRYFQFKNGEPFVGVGFNDGFKGSASVEQKMTSYEQNKMNFMRVWLEGSGINGSQWSAWATYFLGNDGYLPGTSFDIHTTYNGGPVSMRLDNPNPCLYADFWRGGVPVEPNTKYQVTARVKVTGITGPSASGDYGFVIKQGGWLGTDCVKTGTGKRITAPVAGTSDWITVTGSYTSGPSENWLGNLYLTRENASAGQVYIDEVHLYRADDPAKVDLLRQPYANAMEHFDTMSAAQWDLYLQSAEKHGVYLKLVIDEKNEWLRNHLGADGKMTATASNDNFYAAPGTKGRWLEQAWWRYIIARWGYSTAIHSFEFINEGDPYSQSHYEATEAMAKYFHQNDPSRHMVTTSLWHSFPNKEFWANAKYPDIDYADLHAYISTGWGLDASFLPQEMQETAPANVHSGKTSAKVSGSGQSITSIVPRGLAIQGQGEWVIKYWMKASGLASSCPYSSTGSMMRVRWQLDGGLYAQGREGVVPANSETKDFICTSPAGSFDWKQFSSTSDRDGKLLPTTARIMITDNNPHSLNLLLENSRGTGGAAWIDDVQIINPSGQVQPVIGQFETTQMDDDTAWYNQAYGEVFGGGSLVGAHKPLVRGETGIDFVGNQSYNPDMLKDTQGIWLHNNVWGQVNAGGMYDLFWWASETIPSSIFSNFLTYQNFMKGIPLSNGHYRDSQAQTSNPQLRAIGQRDDVNGQIHLWVQNTQHTWKRVVNGPVVIGISGTITLPNVAAGNYRVEWWNTYTTSNPISLTQTLSSNGSLVLTLPATLSDDVAVKIYKIN